MYRRKSIKLTISHNNQEVPILIETTIKNSEKSKVVFYSLQYRWNLKFGNNDFVFPVG